MATNTISMYDSLINLFKMDDIDKGNLYISSSEDDVSDIGHVSGRGIRIFDHGDSCQVMYCNDGIGDLATLITVDDPAVIFNVVMTYFDNVVEDSRE